MYDLIILIYTMLPLLAIGFALCQPPQEFHPDKFDHRKSLENYKSPTMKRVIKNIIEVDATQLKRCLNQKREDRHWSSTTSVDQQQKENQ